jgi:hypothetical protein
MSYDKKAGGITERVEWRKVSMQIMQMSKYFIIFFTFDALINAQAMDYSDSPRLSSPDESTEREVRLDISPFLTGHFDSFALETGSRRESEALAAAQENIKSAEEDLGIFRNTGRRNQFAAGISAIIFGVAKGIFDCFQFTDPNTKDGANVFNVVGDAIFVGAGVYTLKLAWENGGAITEHRKAKIMYYLVKQAGKLDQLDRYRRIDDIHELSTSPVSDRRDLRLQSMERH